MGQMGVMGTKLELLFHLNTDICRNRARSVGDAGRAPFNPTHRQPIGRQGRGARHRAEGPPTWRSEEVKPSVDINEEQTG